MLGRLFGKLVASRRGFGEDEETEREREGARETEYNQNTQDILFGHLGGLEMFTQNDLPFGQTADDENTESTLSDGDSDSEGGYFDWPDPVVADAFVFHLWMGAINFHIILLPLANLWTFVLIVHPEYHEDGLFFANFTNGTGSDFVIEVNQQFIDLINLALFPIFTIPSVPLIFYLESLYKTYLRNGGARYEPELPCWAYLTTLALFFAAPGAPVLLVATGNIPDFVAAFNVPETWFIPGNEAAATSLGFALACMLYVFEFCLCCVLQHLPAKYWPT